MKKLFITTLLFLAISTTFAQEKQNDATWDETIQFIKKYKYHIKGLWLPKWYNRFGEIGFNDYTNTKVKVFGSKVNLILESKNKKINKEVLVTVDLTKLESARSWSNSRNEVIELNLIGKYCFVDEYDKRSKQYPKPEYFKGNFVRLNISNSEIRPRLTKALNHLAYLSKQKRLEYQKKSGDKF